MVALCRIIQSPDPSFSEFRIESPKFRITTKIWDPESNLEYKIHDAENGIPHRLREVTQLCPIILQGFSRFFQIQFAFFFTGITNFSFSCSNYIIHENSTEGRNWETSRWLCQNSTEGDLVSIEGEKERIFLKEIIKNLKTPKYYIGLKIKKGKWRWLNNGISVHASKGKHPWGLDQPGGGPHAKCATIYGNYRTYLDGLFDDLSLIHIWRCRRS